VFGQRTNHTNDNICFDISRTSRAVQASAALVGVAPLANLVCDLQANSIPELWAKVHRLQIYALLDADVVEHGAAATVLLYDLVARAEQSLEAAAAAALQCPLLTGLLSLPAI
jgi:hypothetical protein